MAPLTTQDVLNSGEYLDKNFDPNTLKKDILLGILIHHNVRYPSQHKKDTLVALFNDEIKSRSEELKRAMQRAKRQTASSEGVVDGVTGRSLSTKRKTAAPSRVPVEVTSSRRSSTTPSGTRTSARRAAVKQEEEDLIEEVSIEEIPPPAPAPAPRRKTPVQSTAGTTTKSRKSKKEATPIQEAEDEEEDQGADSAWEHNNPFQSGPSDRESLSPQRAGGSARRTTKTKKATATAPRSSSSPAPPAPEAPTRRSTRRPNPNPSEFQTPLTRVKSASDWKAEGAEVREMSPSGPEDEENDDDDDVPRSSVRPGDELVPLNDTPDYRAYRKQQRASGSVAEDEAEESGEENDGRSPSPTVAALNQLGSKLANLVNGSPSALRRRIKEEPVAAPPKPWSKWTKGIILVALVWLGLSFYQYKADSAYIGFCDFGSNSNLRILELQRDRRLRQAAASACYSRGFTNNTGLCAPVPIHTPFEANTCTRCPDLAVCTPDSVVCNPSFILKPHPLAHVPGLQTLLNGMPFFGSVALPPTCVKDEEKLKRIGGLVMNLESWLAKHRGDQVCLGVVPGDDALGGEAKAFGYEMESLRAAVAAKSRKSDALSDEIFHRALGRLQGSGWIIRSTDPEGFQYVAATRAEFNTTCHLRVLARKAWDANKHRVMGFVVVLLTLLYLRQRSLSASIENKRVGELVQEALTLIQDQELDHHIDNVSAPEPFVVPAQLRDQILSEEHSPSVRQRVWEKVERVVEGNANVRTNVQDVHGEDMRVWRWVGTSTPRRNRSRRVSWAEKTASGSQLNDYDEQ